MTPPLPPPPMNRTLRYTLIVIASLISAFIFLEPMQDMVKALLDLP
jgi:hypothetical protein